jgi:hypothetical protein
MFSSVVCVSLKVKGGLTESGPGFNIFQNVMQKA